jgi:hypothetical protein
MIVDWRLLSTIDRVTPFKARAVWILSTTQEVFP